MGQVLKCQEAPTRQSKHDRMWPSIEGGMMRRLIPLLVLPVLLAMACKPAAEPAGADRSFFPVAEGDWWLYSRETICLSSDSMPWEEGEDMVRVLGEDPEQEGVYLFEQTSTRWLVMGEREETSTLVDTLMYLVAGDSVVFLGETGGGQQGEVFLHLPLEEGQAWGSWAVASLERELDVPAGRFGSCAELQREYEGSMSHWYYCMGIGLVEMAIPELSFGDGSSYSIRKTLVGSSRIR